jgi:outer membrane murein-binding lipoprotein Lpp
VQTRGIAVTQTQAIVRTFSEEELAYASYLAAIDEHKRKIADRQADLETLKLALARFELAYRAKVGPLLVEIDRIRLEITEYRRRLDLLRTDRDYKPEDIEENLEAEFGARREEVRAEQEETRRYQRAFRSERSRPRLDSDTEAEIRRTYRELAKRFHPDLASSSEERSRREEIMLRINAAFRDRDVNGLKRLVRETERDDPAFEERPLEQKLNWAKSEVSRLDSVVAELEHQIEIMRKSDTYPMWQTTQSCETAIERLTADARSKLTRLQDRLEERVVVYERTIKRR